MEREITVYNFFKVMNHYEYTNEGKHCVLSAEMFDCLLNQYKVMGYQVTFDCDLFLSVTKVEDEEIFSKNLAERLDKIAGL